MGKKPVRFYSAGFFKKSLRSIYICSSFSGGIYIPAEILAREEPPSSPHDLTHVQPTDLGLTSRQIEVLALIAQGQTNKAIARTLNMAEPTVKNHITVIFKALKVSNRTEAVIAVGKLGWKLPGLAKS